MFNKLKQFKDLRDQAKVFQQKLAEESITVESNWSKLKLTIDGNMEVKLLSIDPSLLTAENKTSLEKDLAKLFSDGVKKVQRAVAEKMQKEGKLPDLGDMFK